MAICKSCKFCTKAVQLPQEIEDVVDKSWCIVWEDWQSKTANQCKYYESRVEVEPKVKDNYKR